ncbi:MAG TPA: VOC family protein [Acidimicrobiales bacterium]
MSSDWPRPVVHWAIEARDPDAQRRFYADLFGWVIGDGPIMMVEAGLGGPEPGPGGHIQHGAQPRIALYVQVRDLAASLQRVVELGGRKVTDPFDAPGGPTLAAVEDPEGNPLVLVQQ